MGVLCACVELKYDLLMLAVLLNAFTTPFPGIDAFRADVFE